MVGAKGVLAALALSPAFVSAGALAQNGYSFTDAAKSAVHYGVAPAKPVDELRCRRQPRDGGDHDHLGARWCRRPTACPSIAASPA